jgi:hypothetical protein
MARPKTAPTRDDLARLPLAQLRALLKDAIVLERERTRAEKAAQEAAQKRRYSVMGEAVFSYFGDEELAELVRRVITAEVKKPDDLALFDKWLKPNHDAAEMGEVADVLALGGEDRAQAKDSA